MKILPQGKAGWLRTLVPLALVAGGAGALLLHEPGATVTDGRHDLGRNGAFMAHGWIADDAWFSTSPDQLRLMTVYRDTGQAIAKLDALRRAGVQDLFPDLLPAAPSGVLPKAGWSATEMLAYQATAGHQRVMPWVGGTRGTDCLPEKEAWRHAFAASCADLFVKCPHLSGVLVNVVPWRDGDPDLLALLDDLRRALPKDKVLAVVADPPRNLLRRNPDATWSGAYFRQVAGKCGLLVVRLHDSGAGNGRLYRHLVATWTEDALELAAPTPVLLGIADYVENPPNPAHLPAIENLENGLRGIHGGLGASRSGKDLPADYAGVAVFGDHTLTEDKWALWRREFRKAPPPKAAGSAGAGNPASAGKSAPKPAPPPPGPWKPGYRPPEKP